MADFWELLDNYIDKRIWRNRFAPYVAKLGAQLDKFNRTEVTPAWMRDPIRNTRKITCPIMDVEGKRGSSVAVLSHDGVPSHAFNAGVIFDEHFMPEHQTVWIRARLQRNPGHLRLGANKSIDLVVGKKPEPGDFEELPDGKIRIGNGTGELVRELSGVLDGMISVTETLQTFFDAFGDPLKFIPGTPAQNAAVLQYLALVAAGVPGGESASKEIGDVTKNMLSVKEKLETLLC